MSVWNAMPLGGSSEKDRDRLELLLEKLRLTEDPLFQLLFPINNMDLNA